VERIVQHGSAEHTMTISTRVIATTSAAALLTGFVSITSGCDDTGDATGPARGRLDVNVQVTGAPNLEPMMEELDRRGMVATVWLSAAEMEAKCDYIGQLAARGHEIAGKYPGSIDDDTSHAAQSAELEAMLEVSERCTGAPSRGFRATRFTSNQYTHQLMDEHAIPYMVRSNRQVLLSIYTYRPYRLDGHQFAVLPMPLAVYFGQTSSLCDTATSGELTPGQLRLHQEAAIDHNLALGEPLVLEWHPQLTHPGEPGWWGIFVSSLDYIHAKGDRAVATTAEAIVDKYPTAPAQPFEPPRR
jgi:hypothetical protein